MLCNLLDFLPAIWGVDLHLFPGVLAHPNPKRAKTQRPVALSFPRLALIKGLHRHVSVGRFLGDGSSVKGNFDSPLVLPPVHTRT